MTRVSKTKKYQRVTQTKFRAGKINFEEKLKKDLNRASEKDNEGNLEGYARAIRSTWKDSYRMDKIAILDLLEDWLSKTGESLPYFKKLTSQNMFLKYIEADPETRDSKLFTQRRHYAVWDDIKKVIGEALRRQYHGGLKKIHGDTITDSYKGED